jgi:hypothetical protein
MLPEVPPDSLDVLKDLDQAIEDFRRLRDELAATQPETRTVVEAGSAGEPDVTS